MKYDAEFIGKRVKVIRDFDSVLEGSVGIIHKQDLWSVGYTIVFKPRDVVYDDEYCYADEFLWESHDGIEHCYNIPASCLELTDNDSTPESFTKEKIKLSYNTDNIEDVEVKSLRYNYQLPRDEHIKLLLL